MRLLLHICTTLLLLATTQGEGVSSHPWLFVTQADIVRARQAIRNDPNFANIAKELIDRATRSTPDELPPLERGWWETARLKPWKEIYPEANHHTGNVPRRWATLALDCAHASLFSDTPELPMKGKKVLLNLSDYTFEFEHFDVGMNYAMWGAQALEAYDILYDRFTPNERARMDAFFKRMLAAVQKNDAYWVENEPGGFINNHYAWHKLCYVMIGAFYNEPKLIDQALHGPKGMEFLMENGFKDDGLWVEGSIHYQTVATDPLVKAAELLENFNAATTNKNGKSIYAIKNSKGINLLQSYKALIPLLWPDRTLPSIGDAYALRSHLAADSGFEILFRRFREPQFAWLLADRGIRSPAALLEGEPKLQPVSMPSQFSKLWPEMGYLALRSNEGTNYWSGEGRAVFATFSNRPIHQHADKLSINLFADGHLWLPDIEERPAAEHVFSSEVQSKLNRHIVCHNTVMIDEENQRFPKNKLELLEFSSEGDIKRATFGDLHGQLYAGARQLRTVIVTTNCVIDFFEVQTDKPRKIDWITHVDGESTQSSVKSTTKFDLPTNAPWSYLLNARTGSAGNHYVETFKDKKRSNSTLAIELWSEKEMEIIECDFPLVEKPNSPTIPMRIARFHGNHAWFLAIYGRNDNAPVTVDIKNRAHNDWKITVGSATYKLPQLARISPSAK